MNNLYPLGVRVRLKEDFSCASPSGKGAVRFSRGEEGVVVTPDVRTVAGEIAVDCNDHRGPILVKAHQIELATISSVLSSAAVFRSAGIVG